MRAPLLVARFLAELAMLAAYAGLGFVTLGGVAPALLLGVAAPLLVAVVWGLFVSPKARYDIGPAARLAVELALFEGAAAALVLVGQPVTAFLFAVVAVGQRALLSATGGVGPSAAPYDGEP